MDTLTSYEITQPSRRLDRLQTVRAIPVRKRRKVRFLPILVLAAFLAYFFAPLRTNILLLGTDDSPERGGVGRTDTIILASVVPLKPYIGMLSIPRDLWVEIPGVGEQRINTAYFFAEARQGGSGAAAAKATIRENFGVPVRYHAVIHMSGVVSLVDALGGIDIQLDASGSGYPAGTHHLNGAQALAFARDRSASDDFGRMQRAQILISAALAKLLQPSSWSDLPQIFTALTQTVDTNIPPWQAPRLLFALVRAPLFGVDSRTITREMVSPTVTSGGAQVLLPNWEAIRPLTREMFGR
jgi:polyisoprenyl-teichoic acid--peptidoglycan teichoic acid transferase